MLFVIVNVLAFVLLRDSQSVDILPEDRGARPLCMFTKTFKPYFRIGSSGQDEFRSGECAVDVSED